MYIKNNACFRPLKDIDLKKKTKKEQRPQKRVKLIKFGDIFQRKNVVLLFMVRQ